MPEEKKPEVNKEKEAKKGAKGQETKKQKEAEANKHRDNTPGAWTISNRKNQAMRRSRKKHGTLTSEPPVIERK